jgi:hypothetical protein
METVSGPRAAACAEVRLLRLGLRPSPRYATGWLSDRYDVRSPIAIGDARAGRVNDPRNGMIYSFTFPRSIGDEHMLRLAIGRAVSAASSFLSGRSAAECVPP